jgi:hypothetical protein
MAKVDELIVEIKGDIKDLTKKLEEATKKTSESSEKMSGSFNKATSALGSVKLAMGAFAGAAAAVTAAAGGVAIAMNKVADIVSESNLGKKIRINTERFQELSFAAKTVGIDSEGLADAIKDLSVKITDTAKYGGALTDALDGIGLEAKDLAQLSPEEQFLAFADAIKDANAAAGDFAADEVNDAMYQMLPLLRQGSEGMEELAMKARRLGVVISSDEMKGFEQLNQTYIEVKASMAGVVNAMLVGLQPALEGVMELAKGVNEELARLNRTAEDQAYIVDASIEPMHKLKKALEEEHASLQRIVKSMLAVNEQDEGFQENLRATQARAREVAAALNDVNTKLEELNALGPMQGPEGKPKEQDQGLLEKSILENQPSTTVPEQGMLESEIERAQDFYEQLELAEAESLERRKILEQQYLQESIEADKAAKEAKKQLDEQLAKDKMKIQKGMLKNLSSLMNTESRKMFEVGKAASIAMATKDMYESAQSSYKFGSSIGGPPVGAAFAATAVAAGLNNINNIRNTKFGSAGAGAASTGGAAGAGFAGGGGQQTETIERTDVIVNLVGDNFGGDGVVNLIDRLNDAVGDGATLRATQLG